MTSSKRTTEYERCRTLVASLTIHHPQLVQAADDLDHAAPNVHTALRAMQDARPGQPGAQSYNASGGQSDDSTTERHALAVDPTAIDRHGFGAALQAIGSACRWLSGIPVDDGTTNADAQRVKTIRTSAYQLRLIVERWKPREANDKQRRSVAASNEGVWCDHHQTAGIDEPSAHHGTVSGNLAVPMDLCDYCYWQVRRKGSLPSGEAMDRRHRTGKTEKVKA